MNTYETHIEPQQCFIYAVFCNGDSIHTSVNPELTDHEIFHHYLGRTFTFARLDSQDREYEIKTKVVRLIITREDDQSELVEGQLKQPPVSIAFREQEVAV